MKMRVAIRWTATAIESFKPLPKKVRQGLIAKLEALQHGDPTTVEKPLLGPLAGCRSIKYSRYRLLYTTDMQKLKRGETLVTVTVTVVAAGIRKEHDPRDVYRLAEKLIELGLAPNDPNDDDVK